MPEQDTQVIAMIGNLKGEIGELRGQFREVIHNVNNVSAKIDALAITSAQNYDLPAEIAALRVRVTALEVAEHQRAGAVNFGAAFLKSPIVGWIAGAVLAAYAFFKR